MEIYDLYNQTSLTETEFRTSCQDALPAVLDVETLAKYGKVAVLESPKPHVSINQRVERDGVVRDAKGNWVQRWRVEGLTSEQLAERLVDAKFNKNTEINQAWLRANKTSFPFQGKQIECDDLGRSNIDGVAGNIALNGSFPPDFPLAWKAMDNSYVPIPDVATFKQMYTAMTQQGVVNFNKAQKLKKMNADAVTIDEVATIKW